MVKGKKITCKKAEAKQGKIYLGNLPTEGITNEEIEAHFVAFGPVAEVVRPVDKSKNNEPKNFAFITFEREETAKQLVKEGSTNINGHVLNVKTVTVKVGEGSGGKREFDRKSGDVRTGIKTKAGGSSKAGAKTKEMRGQGEGARAQRTDRK